MKKTLSLILALLMSISTASVAFAAEDVAIEDEVAVEETETEEEVVAGPYDDAIKYLGHYGIYKGVSEDDLAADSDVNRYQMALFAARLATGWTADEKWEDGPQNSSEFTDLEGTPAADYYGAISYVNQAGIIEGYGDGTYGPLKGITYQDALTIVVRTLGYQNLNYPWGYIQKGVELGLTEGVVDVAYTDALTRGETAQIIYNALFAETKGGSTLGLDSFGIEFAWEDVVIVSSDKDILLVNEKAPSSFVGFQVVEDGELAETVYYAKAADLGLEGHDDELAVGASYKVFFEKDADSELVSIIDYKPNYVETVWNFGKTDDEGVAVDSYAIVDVLANEYKLVTKYSANYVGNTFAAKDEIIIVDALGGIEELVYVGSNYGIDMNTGDIVTYVENEDGEIEVNVEWYYNAIVDAYYDIVFNAEDDEIGIIYMDEAKEAKLLEAIEKSAWETQVTTGKGFATPLNNDTIDKDSAYASLDIYNVNGKAYGIYEEYKFGYFANGSTKRCSCDGDPARATYTISSRLMYTTKDGKVVNGELGVNAPSSFDQIVEGECKHGTAWINPAFAANATETGYADGYVIYSADAQTGEIKIVKYINDNEDADTYVGNGTIKAFNVAEEYVVIGGERLTFNYDNLEQAGIITVGKNSSTKGEYSDTLRAYFNQYVEYVVVDGEIVYMTIKTASTKNLFVVEQYAGISSDGYIVVDGYWTEAATELTRIRVASYNNNFGGDPFYYMNKEKAAEAFTKGAVYAVSSTEPDANGELVYNVQIVGGVKNGRYTVDTDSKYVNNNKAFTLDADNCEDGYIEINGSVTRDKGFTYILIGDAIGADDHDAYAPIAVYTGKIADPSWAITEGTRINTTDNVYVVVNAKWIGFSRDKVASGVVALLGDFYWTADFDGNDTEDNWYLLGAAEYTVEVFNFYNAAVTTVKATNLDLEEGYIYKTIDGTIVRADKDYAYTVADADALVDLLNDVYADDEPGSADYHIAPIAISADTYDDLKKNISISVSDWIFADDKDYTDLVNEVKEKKMITINEDGTIASITGFNKDTLKDLAEDNGYDSVTLEGFYVYNTSTEKAYVYAIYGNGDYVKSTDGTEVVSDTVIKATTTKDAYIEAVSTVDIVEDENGIVSATLNKVTLSFVGAAAEDDTHKAVKDNSLYFGNAGMCANENWECVVNGKDVYGSIVAEEGLYEGHDEEDICNLIKTVEFDIVPGVVLTEEVQYITIKFVNNLDTAAEINIGAYIDADGNVVARLSRIENCNYGAFAEVIDRPAVLDAK